MPPAMRRQPSCRPPRHPILAIAALVLVAGVAPAPAAAQESAPPPTPNITVIGGLGNSLGWFGGSVEKYLADGRYSLFVGAGYTLEVDNQGPFGLTGAVGGRLYLAGDRWRWFGELSVSQHAVRERVELIPPDQVRIEKERAYGPGLLGGVQFTGRGGFTFHTGLGVGYSSAIENSEWSVLLNLGLGYTWF